MKLVNKDCVLMNEVKCILVPDQINVFLKTGFLFPGVIMPLHFYVFATKEFEK